MKTESADGVEGILLNIGEGIIVFRVYSEPGVFIDYDLLHTDLCVKIQDADATFYTSEGYAKLDHSPETLGIKND